MNKEKTEKKNVENNVVEPENKSKEETIPVKIKEAYDSLMAQAKQFGEQKIQSTTMETKAVGALEVLVQIYPALKESSSDS